MPASHNTHQSTYGVIDIFAGPGGLGEGFSSFLPTTHSPIFPFQLAVSAEMERSAHSTLRLRAFYRLLQRTEGDIPRDYWDYLKMAAVGDAQPPAVYFGNGRWKKLWQEAEAEALNLTLGTEAHNRALFERIDAVRDNFDEMILIGGPPCQAYSLVGRARQKHVAGFKSKGDPRHFLYRQYLEILAKYRPAVFIMENVKGILTSTVGNREMFSAIREDLSDPGKALGRTGGGASSRYVLLPIHVPNGSERTAELVADDPSGFVIRCEHHGIPQARHRVIIMGVRLDCATPMVSKIPGLTTIGTPVPIEAALMGLPSLRSGLSREPDDQRRWFRAVDEERKKVISATRRSMPDVAYALEGTTPECELPRHATRYAQGRVSQLASELRGRSEVVLNHDTRGHMKSDLGRYLFCAAFAQERRRSPMSGEFPATLAPDHKNWETGAFADRFRVQLRGQPSSTITSHLSKDGHAFIHWNPALCRSLSVRESARLQTFPDDYLFLGNRTQQFVQVGNAVPPMIARQIARVVFSVLKFSATETTEIEPKKLDSVTARSLSNAP